jgi:hypothetical protein
LHINPEEALSPDEEITEEGGNELADKVSGVIEAFIAFIVSLILTSALWGAVPTISGISGTIVDMVHVLFVLLDVMTLIYLGLSILPSDD